MLLDLLWTCFISFLLLFHHGIEFASKGLVNKLLSLKELARYLGINEMTLHKHIRDGSIPAIRIGKLWRFDLQEVEKRLKQKIHDSRLKI